MTPSTSALYGYGSRQPHRHAPYSRHDKLCVYMSTRMDRGRRNRFAGSYHRGNCGVNAGNVVTHYEAPDMLTSNPAEISE